MSFETDVLVIGAGIQGVGVAQAAAAAGQRTLLLERGAIAAETSSRSSKLIHGGLRYLESAQFGLVRESLRERRILLRIAPHLVRLVPFLIPVYAGAARSPLMIRAGLSLYALLGGLDHQTRFNKVPRAAWDALDGLRLDGLRAVYRYLDGQTDDAALCRAVAASAAELGASIAVSAEVVGAEQRGGGWTVRYRTDHEVRELTARVVVNAAGPWVNRLLDRFTPAPPRREIELVGGAHVELPGTLGQGLYYVEAPSDRRPVLVMPWQGRLLVGTTETPFDGDPATHGPTPQERTYLLETLEHYFPERSTEVLDTWAGLRVLPRGAQALSRRSREVILVPDRRSRPSLITIYGGKLTGYRATAEKVLKRLLPRLPRAPRKADTATLELPEEGEG